jgi:hypothetical protein
MVRLIEGHVLIGPMTTLLRRDNTLEEAIRIANLKPFN